MNNLPTTVVDRYENDLTVRRSQKFLQALDGAMRSHLDDLDGGLLAPRWIRALNPEQYASAASSFAEDHRLAGIHRVTIPAPAFTACAFDGEPFPCNVLTNLRKKYDRFLATSEETA